MTKQRQADRAQTARVVADHLSSSVLQLLHAVGTGWPIFCQVA